MSSSAPKPAAIAPASYAIPSDGMPGAALLAASVRDVLLRISDVCAITGLSVPTIYRLMGRNKFPRPLKLTSTARAWKLSEIMAWVESREHAATSWRSQPLPALLVSTQI